MKDHKGDFRGYFHLNRAWYGPTIKPDDQIDEVNFGFYSKGGGTSGEMSVVWEMLGGKSTPYLKVWNDAWHTLSKFDCVVKAMAKVDGEHITPKEFCALLDRCGFKDQTPTQKPPCLTPHP